MEFALSEDQVALQRLVRDFLGEQAPEAAVRAATEGPGFDRVLWHRMGHELGLLGLAVPEEFGGGGFGWVELGVVAEELGRALTVSPFLGSTVMAAHLILALADPQLSSRLLPGLASGETIAAVAVAGDDGVWSAEPASVRATGSVLDGVSSFVLGGAEADVLLVVAGASVFEVAGDAPGVTREALATVDQTRKLARVAFTGVPAHLLATGPAVPRAVASMLDHAAIALAADALGGIGRVLELSVDYAGTREQFGRPIGSFQAIKHTCAAMLVDLESARSAVYYALWAAATGQDELPAIASLVKAHCADTYLAAAGENLQIHGGIGFTWEGSAHLYLKRARSTSVLLGDSDLHRRRLADRVGI